MKNKLVTYLAITGLLLILVGVSYAIFEANFIGDKTQEISLGEKFSFSYEEESNGLSITDSDILSDDNGKVSEKYFDFNVKLQTQSEQTINYYIYLTKDETSTLNEKYIKLYLTNQSNSSTKDVTTMKNLIKHGTYENSRYLYGTSITSSNNYLTTHKYRLRVWVSDTYSEEYETIEDETSGLHQSTADEKIYKFTVNVATGELPGTLIETWKDKTENEASYLALYTLNQKELPETYEYNNETYTISETIDVSEQGNNSVLLGEYIYDDKMIAVISGEGAVMAPKFSNSLFSNLYSLMFLDLSNLNTSNVEKMDYMFSGLSKLENLNLENLDTSKVTDMGSMFNGCSKLQTIDLSNLDTSKVTDMGSMFNGCSKLQTIDLSNLDTSKVTDMGSMFGNCSNLTDINFGNVDTSKVTNMSGMFYGCSNLFNLNLENLDTSNVTNMSQMFWNCSNLTSLDLSGFNTTNVTNMSYMFSGCTNLQNLNLNKFDTSNVTDMRRMFFSCRNLANLNLTSFNTSKVTTMFYMFYGCSGLTTINLSSFTVGETTSLNAMFYGCSGLTEVIVGCNWGESSNTSDMFTGAGVSSVTKVCNE